MDSTRLYIRIPTKLKIAARKTLEYRGTTLSKYVRESLEKLLTSA